MKHSIEKDWTTKSGLRAVVVIHSVMYHRCGYVGIPEGHPLYGVNYSANTDNTEEAFRSSPAMVFNVHGGLTYSGGDDYPVEGPEWWFGFDCGHYEDLPVGSEPIEGKTERTLDYVILECERLAQQLLKSKLTTEDVMSKFKHGQLAVDEITKFEGIIVGHSDYMSGCDTYLLQPTIGKDGNYRDGRWFDEDRIKILEPPKPHSKGERPGGPRPVCPSKTH